MRPESIHKYSLPAAQASCWCFLLHFPLEVNERPKVVGISASLCLAYYKYIKVTRQYLGKSKNVGTLPLDFIVFTN